MTSNEGAVMVPAGVVIVLGGLKLALWPWMVRKRGWTRQPTERQ